VAEPGAPDTPVPGLLSIESRRAQHVLELSLRGELDLTSVPVFERELEAAQASEIDHLVIDLSGLEFMDSTGLRALLLVRERAASDGHQLTLRRCPRQVQRVLELTKTVDAFVFED
jgi:anti-sigma B factor antagonist